MALKVDVTVKKSSLVKPAEATWTGRMPLSEFEMTGTITNIDTLYFYKKPTTGSLQNSVTVVNLLKDSLSRTLVTFYPVAGRLQPIGGGRLELDCNGSGVHFIEAEAKTTSLNEVLGFVCGDVSNKPPRRSGTELLPLVPVVNYGGLPISDWPLLLVQLTEFRCGGFCLGFNMSHVAADGLGGLHFFHEWARVARGQGIGTVPFLNRGRVLRAGQPPLTRQPTFDPAQFDRPPVLLLGNNNGSENENAATRLKLTTTQVQILKEMANKDTMSSTTRPYTTYETLTAHIWRSACKARNLEPNQLTAVGVSVDARRRVKPPLPDAYFGDAIIDVKAVSRSGDLVMRPLGYAAGKVREATEKADGEFLWSAIEYLKNQPDLTKFRDCYDEDDDKPFYGIPNLVVTSWLRLPLLGLDFGFGKEVHMDTTFDFDGDTTLSQSQDGDGSIVVSICLRSDHIDAFDRFFYDDIPKA